MEHGALRALFILIYFTFARICCFMSVSFLRVYMYTLGILVMEILHKRNLIVTPVFQRGMLLRILYP